MLSHAVLLLRELPRGREDVGDARSRFEGFRATYPGVRADLLVDQPPGSRQVDYDLLLEHPEGGTVALSWRADDAIPWSVEYADHWAANHVVTVNNHGLTVQQALLFLKLVSSQSPDLMTEMVDQALIAQAIDENPPSVNKEELQAAADEFRSADGLYSADGTHRWLEETGLSVTRFAELLRRVIQRRKLEERVTKDQIQPYFQAHRESFDTVQFFRVDTQNKAVARRLVESPRKKSLLLATHARLTGAEGGGLEGSLISRYARDLPSNLANAPPGKVVGPVAEGGGFWVAEVLQRQPARLDTQTHAAIRDQLFREWLAQRRHQATVRWHWT